ncbi:MAG TPA: dipicolinate synthase subunit B [Ruminococcaceae bacterium]|nr:dipicolinate synthase subunit B [Oscillospiraceae bacterium]
MTIGFAFTGSFCTFSQVIPQIEKIVKAGHTVIPIFSDTSYKTDTRFGEAKKFREKVEQITGHEVWHTVTQTEPIGPQKLLDVLVVAPCDSNTLAKLANGINDTAVTMACKSHLRNGRAVVLAISTNDALGFSAKNIGTLLAFRDYYFVPFGQDDFKKKPRSMVAYFNLILPTVEAAVRGEQIQPILR